MANFKTKILLNSGPITETYGPSRYFFVPISSGYFLTEPLSGGDYASEITLGVSGKASVFPQNLNGSGGIKLTGSVELGQFFNYLDLESDVTTKYYVSETTIVENSPFAFPVIDGQIYSSTTIEGAIGGGTCIAHGGLITGGKADWKPNIITASGGLKIGGYGLEGTQLFYTSGFSANPYTHIYVPYSGIYGQTKTLATPGSIAPASGGFYNEEYLESISGIIFTGATAYWKVRKYDYGITNGGYVLGGTTDINSATNKAVQTPSISGGLEFGPSTHIDVICIKKFTYVGNGGVFYYGPSNSVDVITGIFNNASYLKRNVPGQSLISGSGVLFWAYDEYAHTSKGTNFLISERGQRKFGSSPYKFTWSTKFKSDSRLQYNPTNSIAILGAMVISNDPDFPPDYDYGSNVYYGVKSGYGTGTPVIVFHSEGSGKDQGFHWESISTSIPFNTEHRLVVHFDSTQTNSTDRIKVYLNGTLVSVNSGVSTFPELDSDGYSNLDWFTMNYYYHGIGSSYLSSYSYGDTSAFLGTIYESIFLDGLLKTDSELYSGSYSGSYNSSYSYHLKYTDPNDLGRDYSGNGVHFTDNTDLTEGELYDTYIFEPIKSSQIVSLSSYLNDKIFTFYSKVYVANCIRNYGIYNQWDTGNETTLQTQALRGYGYSLDNPTRFTFGARIWVDPLYDYVEDYSADGDNLTILSLAAIDYNPDPYYVDKLQFYLKNSSSGANFDTEYKGVSLVVESSSVLLEIELRSILISVNTYHRLVVQVETGLDQEQDRIRVFLNGIRIDLGNVISRWLTDWTTEPPSQYLSYGYPEQNSKVFNNWTSVNAPSNVAVCVGCVGFSNISTPTWESFLGKLTDVILLDGMIKDPNEVLPISGSYSGEYGGTGSFHYKFDTLGQDSGPNNYSLTNVGQTSVTKALINENSESVLFAIQNYDGYYKDVTKYFKFGFADNITQNFLNYEYVENGSVIAQGTTSTSVSTDTWHDLQITVDTSNSSNANRIKIYLNKNLLSYSSISYIPKDTILYSGSGELYSPYTVIGNLVRNNNSLQTKGFSGFLISTIYIDGYIIEPDFFDPITYPISYGGAGFRLDYSYLSNVGYDSSPYKNHFTVEGVLSSIGIYDNNYDWGKAIGFEILRDTTPIQDINLFFKLISAEEIELQLVFNITLDPLIAVLPFKLIGSGIEVELNLPFILTWTSNFDSGTHTNTEVIVTTPNTPIPITYENISGTLITDPTNTIHYEFGTSSSDPNALNGWINQSTGEIVIFDLDTQLNNEASNVIYEGSNVNVNYDYNLAQSLLIWSMSCSIGQLVGEISVEYEEDASTVAKFTIFPEPGEIDPLEYIGKSVSLSVTFSDSKGGPYSGSGGVIFTGVVSEVEWDADLRVLNVTADTQMPAYFNSLSREEIDSVVGGIWSSQVWDNEDDSTGWTYAQERLGTTENTIWHDRNGTLRINSFKAGGSSITFTDNERFHETLKLEFAQRSEMVNQIRIDLSYSYPRRREAKIQFKWTDPSNGQIQTFLCGGNSYQLCQRSMVEGAATGGSWVPISQITYDPIWPAQVVSCGGGIYDFIVWGFQLNNIYTPVKTDTGEWQKVNLINLSTGKLNTSTNKMEYTTTPGDPTQSWSQESLVPPEVTNALCIGAKWTAARRWIQSVSEEYEITIQCKDSIDTIGVVASTESYSIDSGIEDDEWENSLTPYKYTPPSGSLSIPGSGDPYWNLDDTSELEDVVTREDFALAQEVIMAAAKTDILKAHRLTTVSFKVPYQSGVDLSQTITVDTPYLSAIGKLRMIKHQFSIDTGEASTELFMAISRHNGNGLYQDDPLEPLERPEPATEEPIDSSIKLGNYVGGRTWGNQGFTGRWEDGRADGEEDPDNEGEWLEEPWEGFMTNYESPLNSNDWNAYMSVPSNLVVEAAWKARLDVASYTIPYQFIVRGPDIDEAHTNASEVQASQVYNVNIPVDYLRISA